MSKDKHSTDSAPKQFLIDEIKDFHPLVAQWLTNNGYNYQYEYRMPDWGRADYIATHIQTKRQLLIECKCDGHLDKAIMQVLGYRMQIPEAHAAIAIPQGWLSDKSRQLAERYEVHIIEIDVSRAEEITKSRQKAQNIYTYKDDDIAVVSADEWEYTLELLYDSLDDDLAHRVIHSILMMALGSKRFVYKDGLLDFVAGVPEAKEVWLNWLDGKIPSKSDK